jgi:hypothetical protein
VFPDTDWAIIYPNSSSGPFQYWGLFVNPDVGAPIDNSPTCSVPGIVVPKLYAKGLANAML